MPQGAGGRKRWGSSPWATWVREKITTVLIMCIGMWLPYSPQPKAIETLQKSIGNSQGSGRNPSLRRDRWGKQNSTFQESTRKIVTFVLCLFLCNWICPQTRVKSGSDLENAKVGLAKITRYIEDIATAGKQDLRASLGN